MPIERISKSFKDISMTFKINPLNSDIFGLKNETAISRSIRNLILTIKGERFFDLDIGCGVNSLLFENMDTLTASRIKSEIEDVIKNYEPRVNLIDVEVQPNYDDHVFEIIIKYEIIGIEVLPQQLSFVLESSR